MLADAGIEARSCEVDGEGLVVDRIAALCAAGEHVPQTGELFCSAVNTAGMGCAAHCSSSCCSAAHTAAPPGSARRVAAQCTLLIWTVPPTPGSPPHFVYTIPNFHNPLGVRQMKRANSRTSHVSPCADLAADGARRDPWQDRSLTIVRRPGCASRSASAAAAAASWSRWRSSTTSW